MSPKIDKIDIYHTGKNTYPGTIAISSEVLLRITGLTMPTKCDGCLLWDSIWE